MKTKDISLLTLDPGSGCSTTSRRVCFTPNTFTLTTSKMRDRPSTDEKEKDVKKRERIKLVTKDFLNKSYPTQILTSSS